MNSLISQICTGDIARNEIITAIENCSDTPLTAQELADKIIAIMLNNGYRMIDWNHIVISIDEYNRLIQNSGTPFYPFGPTITWTTITNSIT